MGEKSLLAEEQKAEKSYLPKFPKSERILSRLERARIVAKGKSNQYSNFLISILENKEWGLSLIVSKNVKPATKRNYLRRIVREAYRNAKPYCHTPKKCAVTIVRADQKVDFERLKKIFIEG